MDRPLAVRYLAAQLRLTTGRSTQGWSDMEIIESSLFCPSGGLGLDEWSAGLKSIAGPQTQEDAIADHNERALRELKRAEPGIIKVEEVE